MSMLTAMIVMLVMTGSTNRDHDHIHSHADDDRDVSSGGYCNVCSSHGDDCGGLRGENDDDADSDGSDYWLLAVTDLLIVTKMMVLMMKTRSR